MKYINLRIMVNLYKLDNLYNYVGFIYLCNWKQALKLIFNYISLTFGLQGTVSYSCRLGETLVSFFLFGEGEFRNFNIPDLFGNLLIVNVFMAHNYIKIQINGRGSRQKYD